MAWQDRISEAAYRSPGGVRTVFTFQDVSRSIDKKTSAYDFPDASGTLVQDLGNTGRRYPLRVIFYGDDHDLQADAFELTLLEQGVGQLEHPRYGRVDVVPFGEITQRDDLKTAANQTIIQVVFWATIGTAYPTSQVDSTARALASIDAYQAATGGELEDAVNIDTQLERVTFRDQWESFTNNTALVLGDVAAATEEVEREFNAINDSINRGIDVLVGDPLTLAFQTFALIRAPARAAAQIEARLNAYGALAGSITRGQSGRIGAAPTEVPQIVEPTNDSRADNELASRVIFARGAVAAAADAAVQSEYATQPQAIAAAEQLLEQFAQVTDWADRNYCALPDAVDTGASYQQLQDAVAVAAGAIVRQSFDLKRERRITLTHPRSLYDFVGEWYGSVDDNLDFFINTNELTGSEILELPAGRMVVVYV